MANYLSNYEIAQAISEKIGVSPIPFDSVYSIALKIYKELGGEETQFDSVYSILLGILPLAERGGSGTIEDMATLPDANQYKNKVVRLTTDNNLYQSYLKSSETITTNRLPDYQQIDKAYLYEVAESIYYYKGTYEITCSNGVLNWYLWKDDVRNIMVATEENFTSDITNAPIIDIDAENGYWTIITETGATTTMSVSEVENYDTIRGWGFMALIPAIYNAPEANQIGNAYIEYNGYVWTYTGEVGTADDTKTEYSGYTWKNNENNYIISTKKASEIFYATDNGLFIGDFILVEHNGHSVIQLNEGNTDSLYIPQLNAPDSEQVGNAKIYDTINNTYYVYTKSVNIHCGNDEVPAYLWVAENPSVVQWSNIMSNAPSTCYSSIPTGVVCDENIYYNSQNDTWYCVEDADTLSIWLSGTIFYGSVGQFKYSDLVKYQRTETIEKWDWKALTNDWAVGAIYRYYNPDVAGTSYGPQEWITAILNFTTKDSTKEYLQKLKDSGYGDGTFLIVHFKYWNSTEWVEDRVAISVYNALNDGGIMTAEEFNTYVNEILNVKTNAYDAHNYIYITNIGIYLENVLWNTEALAFDTNVFSDAIAFPINTAIHPDYIELYPQKND